MQRIRESVQVHVWNRTGSRIKFHQGTIVRFAKLLDCHGSEPFTMHQAPAISNCSGENGENNEIHSHVRSVKGGKMERG